MVVRDEDFPLRPDHALRDKYAAVTTQDLYQWQQHSRASLTPFVLHDGPPYANGHLHMGHALNKILKDIINRYHLSIGERIHYHPGWDCHGLPIELKALKALADCDRGVRGDRGNDTTPTPTQVRHAARATALSSIETQKKEFAALAILADMGSDKSTYRTLDHSYEMRQLRLFTQLVRDNLAYRAFRPVYWSPSSRTALAEAELEYNDKHKSTSVFVSFPVVGKSRALMEREDSNTHTHAPLNLLCWTTTPWSLVGNMAVCVHAQLQYVIARQASTGVRYVLALDRLTAMQEILGEMEVLHTLSGQDLVGCTYTPPFHPNNTTSDNNTTSAPPAFPILAANHVSADTGTGLVHTAASHGHDDYIAVQAELQRQKMEQSEQGEAHAHDNLHKAAAHSHSHPLPILNPVDEQGRYDGSAVRAICGQDEGSALDGLECLSEGSKAVIELLQKREHAQGQDHAWIIATDTITHRYPHDWRTKQPILIRATSQWFANVHSLKQNALTALDAVEFVPENGRARLEAFVMGRAEWCISRQRAWGVPIPVLYRDGEPLLDENVLKYTIDILHQRGTDAWWTDPAHDFVPEELRASLDDCTLTKGADTMDVWFDSGSSWMGLDEGTSTASTAKKPPADIYLEGSDQHRGWFQSSLLTAVAAGRGAPYGTLITHGMVVDELGRKMSKSLGNGLSPLDVVNGTQSLPRYGPDVLRFWAASVEYTKDVPIGPTIIAQSADSLRKIRNAARFMLGNVGSGMRERTEHNHDHEHALALMDKWLLHHLHTLDSACRDAYAQHSFSRVTHALLSFTSGPLATYFEMAKDTLYNERQEDRGRRCVVHVLERTLDTLTRAVAPIAPLLAEEIHCHRHGAERDNEKETDTHASVFATPWIPLDAAAYEDALQSADVVLSWRDDVLAQLEKLRSDKVIKTSLEATVDIHVGAECNDVVKKAIHSIDSFAKAFVVSSVQLHTIKNSNDVKISVQKSGQEKCPRCWSFNRPSQEALCRRCTTVVQN
ncbi:hypothetical protein E3P99_02380 [Wallemia hederae]|uniref:isoleucine--tRNA ligase n=1 Tax=Wallemia hederae TaxID=1540922 RepID=A0A4T0FKS1_9BASI|nr:hypothetical protein E3P99_02380 [Wallemia hederae]